jgi:hypothetical protein
VPNLTTSDDGNLPLILTKGPKSLAQSNIVLDNAYPWKTKGIVVYRVGNSSEFIKSGTGGAKVGSVNIGITNSNTILQP